MIHITIIFIVVTVFVLLILHIKSKYRDIAELISMNKERDIEYGKLLKFNESIINTAINTNKANIIINESFINLLNKVDEITDFSKSDLTELKLILIEANESLKEIDL